MKNDDAVKWIRYHLRKFPFSKFELAQLPTVFELHRKYGLYFDFCDCFANVSNDEACHAFMEHFQVKLGRKSTYYEFLLRHLFEFAASEKTQRIFSEIMRTLTQGTALNISIPTSTTSTMNATVFDGQEGEKL